MIAEQKCPNCGGALIFDPAMGKLRCEFCDSIFDDHQIADKILVFAVVPLRIIFHHFTIFTDTACFLTFSVNIPAILFR